MKDIILELDGSSGHKRPPRKGRKISQIANGSILLLNISVYQVIICFQKFPFVSLLTFERTTNMFQVGYLAYMFFFTYTHNTL